jgi:hypothetical protein
MFVALSYSPRLASLWDPCAFDLQLPTVRTQSKRVPHVGSDSREASFLVVKCDTSPTGACAALYGSCLAQRGPGNSNPV